MIIDPDLMAHTPNGPNIAQRTRLCPAPQRACARPSGADAAEGSTSLAGAGQAGQAAVSLGRAW